MARRKKKVRRKARYDEGFIRGGGLVGGGDRSAYSAGSRMSDEARRRRLGGIGEGVNRGMILSSGRTIDSGYIKGGEIPCKK